MFCYTYTRLINYFTFILLFITSLWVLAIYNKSIVWYQLLFNIYYEPYLQISYIIGIDGLSIFFILLSVYLLMLCFLAYWRLRYNHTLYTFLLLITLWLLLNIFSVLDLFLFYIFYEAIVIPMYLFIGIWGSRSRKIYASYQFFIYTLFGSVFVLLRFLNIYFQKGSSSFDYIVYTPHITNRYVLFWIFMFLGFAVKIPILPLHIWLPEAHVEAPTPGSVILAGILLKLGTYAMMRLLIIPFFGLSDDLAIFVITLALVGFTYTSLVAINQIDIKKIIAYSSIAHMNFSLLGMFSSSLIGISGMFFLTLGHAITSGALFIGVGILYDRYKTRLIFYYGSLVIFMPLFSIMYFIFILSNFGFPGTINFVGEFMILAGILEFINIVVILAAVGSVLSLVYSLFLYTRIFYGNFCEMFIRYYCDCTRLEFFILLNFCIFIIIGGLYPMGILSISLPSIMKLYFISF